MSWSRQDKRLETSGVYESSDADFGNPPPFKHFVFLTLRTWTDRDGDLHARILILSSENERQYPTGSVHEINPAFWLWTSAERIA